MHLPTYIDGEGPIVVMVHGRGEVPEIFGAPRHTFLETRLR